jgi:hypothetical protein
MGYTPQFKNVEEKFPSVAVRAPVPTSGRVNSFVATAQDGTLDDNWVLWLRLPGRKKSIRATLALEVLDVFVGQLDIALAVSGSQHMLAGMAGDDDCVCTSLELKSKLRTATPPRRRAA